MSCFLNYNLSSIRNRRRLTLQDAKAILESDLPDALVMHETGMSITTVQNVRNGKWASSADRPEYHRAWRKSKYYPR